MSTKALYQQQIAPEGKRLIIFVRRGHGRPPLDCRGDVDTIGAMAGALRGIANGSGRLPAVRLEARDQLVDVALRLFRLGV